MIEVAISRGQPLPDWFINEPERITGDDFYLKAFSNLSTCRQLGMDVGPIPWNAIILFAQYHCLDVETTDIFVSIIKAMDQSWLDWQRKAREKSEQQ